MPSSFRTMSRANVLVVVILLLHFKTWCVAKPSSDEATLIGNINFACSETSCKDLLGKGGPCYLPDNLWNHASLAMNLYYQAKGRNTWNCHFAGSGLIVTTDPSESSRLPHKT
ncbi:hypothetical protein MLD38_012635 [Melastoma candidum]|uniref:Uncharacterized protein n=1 Tax=Melastoma candidum TaxID=119954 RepID=A0ACB9R6Y6_9MYRT|nr:hypothetical protein MLD38_012635 [Melastoma candidum]